MMSLTVRFDLARRSEMISPIRQMIPGVDETRGAGAAWWTASDDQPELYCRIWGLTGGL